MQHCAARPHGHLPRDGIDRRHGDIFELESHDMHMARKLAHGVEVFISGLDFHVRNLTRWRVGLRRERVYAVAHAARRDGEHAPQLAASEHSDGRTWQDGRGQGSVSPNTLWVCSVRNWRSLSRSSGRWLARMATASKAALVAPAWPMASVPTGMPPGICTMDRSESMPLSVRLSTGTPRTGSV